MLILRAVKDEHPHTLAQIGRRFGITRERVRQIEQNVIDTAEESVREYFDWDASYM
ncbi:MAG: sigma factor-like helix-turn-helix DNA-binding protein [Thermoleophilia bacterium]